jgi:hypothetical protein
MRWLICIVGSTRVFVSASSVGLIAEYDVGPPPPLSSPYVAGIGVLMDALVLSIRVGFHPPACRRKTQGLLLTTATSPLRWAFEIDRSVGLVDAPPLDTVDSEPPWLRRNRHGDRVLDVVAMVQELGGT